MFKPGNETESKINSIKRPSHHVNRTFNPSIKLVRGAISASLSKEKELSGNQKPRMKKNKKNGHTLCTSVAIDIALMR